MTARPKSARSNRQALPLWLRHLMPLLAGLLLAALSACSTPPVNYPIPPANCSKRVPAALLSQVQGWPLPATDTAQDWQAFGVGESGQRVQANNRGDTVLAIVASCEAREAEIYDALTRRKKVLGIF